MFVWDRDIRDIRDILGVCVFLLFVSVTVTSVTSVTFCVVLLCSGLFCVWCVCLQLSLGSSQALRLL